MAKAFDPLLPLIFVACFLPTWYFIGRRALPWWTDGGMWLKYAYGLLSNDTPFWGEPPTIYPPFFTVLLALTLLLLNDPALSIKILAALVFSLRPVVAYYSSLMIFRSRITALATALSFIFLPIHVEMLGWGGYPNLLAISLIMLSISLLVEWLRGEISKPKMAALLFISSLIAITHNLSLLVFLTSLTLLALGALVLRRKREAAKCVMAALPAVLTYGLYAVATGWYQYYVMNNEAAYYRLAPNLSSGMLSWIFKNNNVILIMLCLFMVSTILYAVYRKRFRIETGVLSAWLISPLLLVNLHNIGLAIDYNRVFYFFVDPYIFLSIGLVASLLGGVAGVHNLSIDQFGNWFAEIVKAGLNGGKYARQLVSIIVVFIVLAVSIGLVFTGYSTFISIENWYNFRDKYGDREKLEAVNWIRENTPPDAVVVADEEIGRWIEGIAHRKVLMNSHPMFLFLQGEAERTYVARAVLLSAITLKSPGCVIYVPSDPREEVSIRVSLFLMGAYVNVLFINTSETHIKITTIDKQHETIYLSDANEYEINQLDNRIVVTYIFDHVKLEQVLETEENGKTCSIYFHLRPTNPRVKSLELVVGLDIWPELKSWEVWSEPVRTLKLVTSEGEFYVASNASHAFPFHFKESDAISGYISVWSRYHCNMSEKSSIIKVDDLLSRLGPFYVVVPRLQNPHLTKSIPLEPVTKDEYMHLLRSNLYELVYQNNKVIVLKYRQN